MLSAFAEYTRCPDTFLSSQLDGELELDQGFFTWGDELVLYGRISSGSLATNVSETLYDIEKSVKNDGNIILPFNPTEIINNLRCEKYLGNPDRRQEGSFGIKVLGKKLYYLFRPMLPVGVRKHVQKLALKGWNNLPFPAWPVDSTIEGIVEKIWSVVLGAHGLDEIPFIWFWPRGYSSCCIMTHDVETLAGRDFCNEIIAIEGSFDIKSSFEIVPESRYEVPRKFLDEIRQCECEICLHGLNHDGALFISESEFRKRANRINEYARQYGAVGFRSPIMYRRPEWFNAFDFSYDMSVPNVAHLDPQRGGCCTVMPFFIGDIIELPLTTIQDYALYNILGQYSLDLWREQTDLVLTRHGLLSFIIHPDYALSQRHQNLYKSLLEMLAGLREDRAMWIALPGKVAEWWRERNQMKLVNDGGKWHIENNNSKRAQVAYAMLEDGRVRYRVEDAIG